MKPIASRSRSTGYAEGRSLRRSTPSLGWLKAAPILALLTLTACHLTAAPAAAPNPAVTPFTGRMMSTCSPVDAQATRIDLAPAVGSDWPTVSISLWSFGFPDPPIVKEFTNGAEGEARWCTSDEGCALATRGSISFDSVDQDGDVLGRFSLTTPSLRRLTGTFRIKPVLDAPAICG